MAKLLSRGGEGVEGKGYFLVLPFDSGIFQEFEFFLYFLRLAYFFTIRLSKLPESKTDSALSQIN